jgi:hypothetical protein
MEVPAFLLELERPGTPISQDDFAMFEARMVVMRQEFKALSKGGAYFSLRELLNDRDPHKPKEDWFDIDEYCEGFEPSPYREKIEATTKAWAQKWGIWLEEYGDGMNSMPSYLNAEGEEGRLQDISDFYAYSFYLNDRFGREKQQNLSPAEQQESQELIVALVKMLQTQQLGPNPTNVELAGWELLERFRTGSQASPEWFSRFVEELMKHLFFSIRNHEPLLKKAFLSLVDYDFLRRIIGGMNTVSLFNEYQSGEFIDWQQLDTLEDEYPTIKELSFMLQSMTGLAEPIGCDLNDLISLVKEVVIEGSNFNYVVLAIFNNLELTLTQAIIQSADHVRELYKASRQIERYLPGVIDQCLEQQLLDEKQTSAIRKYANALVTNNKASWVWELITSRYKTMLAIFREFRIDEQGEAA